MTADALTVSPEQQRAAYDLLGLDADFWDRTMRIEILPDRVRVVRWAGAPGDKRHLGADGEVPEVVTVIPLRSSSDVAA